MNPLYQQLLMQNMPGNNILTFFQKFQQFRNNFQGDPKQQIEAMLKSGQISQQQYDAAVAQAQQLRQFLT